MSGNADSPVGTDVTVVHVKYVILARRRRLREAKVTSTSLAATFIEGTFNLL